MIFIFCFAVIFILLWINELIKDKDCPKCGSKLLDKIPNGYHCRHCGKLWHMNIFGVLKDYYKK